VRRSPWNLKKCGIWRKKPVVEERSRQLEDLGFALFDSFHVACAEAAGADIFLSTDDRLLKTARRCGDQLNVTIGNPVVWLIEVLQEQ